MKAEIRTPHRKLFAQVVCALLAVPVLYVAGSGPLIRCTFHDPGAAAVTKAVYSPLFRLLDATPFENAWLHYLHWWDINVLDMGDDLANPYFYRGHQP
jgi:hypothetical protein